MFNLSRYFSTVSFILIVMAAGVLGPLYRVLSIQQMTELAEHRNVAMAQVFESFLGSPLASLMSASLGRDAAFLKSSVESEQLRGSVAALMRNTSVVKVKIYSRLGMTVFSSDSAQLGEDKLKNPGFRSAMSGKVLSELTHRNTINTFEGERSDIDVLSSYVPIVNKDGSIEGVFELYQDVSPFVSQLERSLW